LDILENPLLDRDCRPFEAVFGGVKYLPGYSPAPTRSLRSPTTFRTRSPPPSDARPTTSTRRVLWVSPRSTHLSTSG